MEATDSKKSDSNPLVELNEQCPQANAPIGILEDVQRRPCYGMRERCSFAQ